MGLHFILFECLRGTSHHSWWGLTTNAAPVWYNVLPTCTKFTSRLQRARHLFSKKKSHTILCVIGLSVCILIVLVSTKSSSTASLCTSFLFNEWNLLLLKNLSLSKEVYSGGSNDFFCVSEMARQQSMHFCGRITCFFGVEVKIFLLWIGLSNSGGESCPSSICWLDPNRRNWRCLEEKLAVTTITFWHFVFTRSFVSNKPGWGPIWPFGNNTLETRNISLRFARPWA